VKLHNHRLTDGSFVEDAGFFAVPGAHLYTVLHQVTDPVARILLVGPFTSDRHNSYHPWVRWARYLAARQIEVLRYDYRGVGESTGTFEEMNFEKWVEDVQLLAEWVTNHLSDVPLVLHGLELGAILAGKCFHEGVGDALLLWSPPGIANQALRSTLLQSAGLKQLFQSAEDRKPAAAYIKQLEQGLSVEVNGYQWSSQLWLDSFDVSLPPDLRDEKRAALTYSRPVKISVLGKDASPLVKPFLGYLEVKDFEWLFSLNHEWIISALALQTGG
jgi:alpha/beta superfamily hydrolase